MVNSKEKGGPSGPPPWYMKGEIFPLKLYGRPGHPPRPTELPLQLPLQGIGRLAFNINFQETNDMANRSE